MTARPARWSHTILAFEPEFRGGVFVAAGDVNGDGYVDVVAGSGEGRSGQVKVFSGRDRSVLVDTFVFESRVHRRRARRGRRRQRRRPRGSRRRRGPRRDGRSRSSTAPISRCCARFTAYPGFTGGVFVAAGDVTGDGYADIVTGAGAGGGPHVQVFDGRTGAETLSFFAFAPSFTGGVRVAAGDVNGDGHAEIIVGAGPGGARRGPRLRSGDDHAAEQRPRVPARVHRRRVRGDGGAGQPDGDRHAAARAPRSRSAFTLSGWAFEDGGGGTAGIAGIDVLAVPVGGGEPIAVGAATLGDPRPDVAAIYGAPVRQRRLPSGGERPAARRLRPARAGARRSEPRRRTCGGSCASRSRRTRSRCSRSTCRSAGRLSSGDFAVAGWALTPETLPAPGVDAVHVWAAPVGGGAWRFLGAATLGVPRPDVAIVFGSQYATAGYYLTVTGLPPGTWDLQVFPRRDRRGRVRGGARRPRDRAGRHRRARS